MNEVVESFLAELSRVLYFKAHAVILKFFLSINKATEALHGELFAGVEIIDFIAAGGDEEQNENF